MTDSINIFPPFWRFLDANGDPVSGGTLEFYLAGSSTPLSVYSNAGLSNALGTTVYCDSGGHPVASSGSSTKVTIWTGTTDFKVIGKTSAGATLGTLDNFSGAIDTSAFAPTSAAPEIKVVQKATTTWSVNAADTAELYNCNVASGSQLATFPSAITAGDGYLFGLRHDAAGSINTVTYQTVSSQTIKEGGSAASSAGTLTSYGETKWFQSDGSGWTVSGYAPPSIQHGRMLIVADRITVFPASPTAGAWYLFSGTPTGTALTLGFAEKDLAQANGIGGWIKHSPVSGMLVWVDDEDFAYAYSGSAWQVWSNITAPADSNLAYGVWEDQKANGTAGGTPVAGSRQDRTLNTEVANTITGASLASNAITLPAGSYLVRVTMPLTAADDAQAFFKSTTTSTELASVSSLMPTSIGTQLLEISGIIVLTASEAFKVQYRFQTALVTNGLGYPTTTFNEGVERYTKVTILRLNAVQGPTGSTGSTGATGRDAGLGRWSFSTSTSPTPSTGTFRFNSATLGSITSLYLHETDADSRALAAVLALFDDSGSAIKGTLCFTMQNTPGTFIVLSITGALTDNGSDITVPVLYVAGALPANADSMLLSTFGRTGDTGSTGAAGATGSAGAAGATGATGPNTGLDYAFGTATTGDPGSGKFGYDSATVASITTLRISETGRNGESLAALLATWDDSTNTTHFGHLRLFTVADRTKFVELEITGTITDSGAYWTIPVTYTAGGTLHASNDVCAVMFERTGNKGADGVGTGDVVGPAASVDSEIALYNSTTGKLIKRASFTGIVKATAGVASAATAGTDYVAPGGALGTPSSGTGTYLTGIPIATGISGLGSGVATALAVNVGSAGAPVVLNGALGTPSGGTLTSVTGLPISTGVSGLGANVATALAVAVGSAGAPIVLNGVLGTPSSGTLTNATGLPVSTGVSGLGTGVGTALAVAVGSAGAFVTFNGALGTPSSGTLTNATGLPISTGVSGLGTGVATILATASTSSGSVGYLNVPINSQSAAYTTVAADAGKAIFHPSADTTARTFTIDSNANVAYPTGTVITFINQISAGVVTISITTDTMYLAGTGTTGSRTLAAHGVATAIKMTSTTWILSGTGLT